MRNIVKDKMISNSIIYIGSNLILKAFNFLLLPLYTAYLSTSDYGITNLVTKFQNVAGYIIACCLQVAAIRFYSEYKSNNEKVKRLFGTIISFTFLSGICFLLLCVIFNKLLISVVLFGIVFWPTIFMSVVALIFITTLTVFQEIMKGMQKAKVVAIASFAYFFIQLGLNIMTVVVMKLGANGVIASSIISNSVVSFAMLLYLIKKKLFVPCIDKKILVATLKYSLPLLPHNVAASTSQLVSNVFINKFASLSSVGIFALASQFGSIAEMVQSSSNTAFQPWFYDEMNSKENGYIQQIRQKSNLLVWFYGFVLISLCFFSKEAVYLFCNQAYSQAWTVVPLIVMVYVANIPYFFFVNILFYFKKGTKYVFFATLPASVINVVLSYFLIQKYDMYGSVISDIIFVVIKMVIIYYLSKKFDTDTLKMKDYIVKIIFILFIASIGMIPSYVVFGNKFSVTEMVFKIIILLLYIVFVIAFNRKRIPKIGDR